MAQAKVLTEKDVRRVLLYIAAHKLELPQFTGHFDLLEQGHRLQ